MTTLETADAIRARFARDMAFHALDAMRDAINHYRATTTYAAPADVAALCALLDMLHDLHELAQDCVRTVAIVSERLDGPRIPVQTAVLG